MESTNYKQQVQSYLEDRRLMALATAGKEFPWICNVYYVIDAELNFYFLSSTTSIHARQLKENPKVALTVADSDQVPEKARVAIQATGEAEMVTDIPKIEWFLSKWTKTPEKYPPQELAQGDKRAVYKITPTKMKYFNTEIFKEEGHFVWVI